MLTMTLMRVISFHSQLGSTTDCCAVGSVQDPAKMGRMREDALTHKEYVEMTIQGTP